MRSTYELAHHTGWYSVDPAQRVSYGDEFAHYRAESRSARGGS
ncbi:hypothetical protein ABZ904_41865 [Streptomyces sp. NPDC046900]